MGIPTERATLPRNVDYVKHNSVSNASNLSWHLIVGRCACFRNAGGYGYNLLFTGPPGTGKTLLASRLPGLLPPLDEHEALEVAAIQSVSGHTPLSSWPLRPFRHPHHSASGPALVGGSCRFSK